MRVLATGAAGMAPSQWRAVALLSASVQSRRPISTFGDQGSSILGTTSASADLMKSLQEDLDRENNIRKHGIGETLSNYVHRAELSHMESPEADQKFVERFDKQVEDFFAKIPTPADPMAAALARTDEELEESAAAEMLREAVREAYLRRLSAQEAEKLRLRRAMQAVERHGYKAPSEADRNWSPDVAANIDPDAVRAAVERLRSGTAEPTQTRPRHAQDMLREERTLEEEMGDIADAFDEDTLREELGAMQRKMKAIEALLSAKKAKTKGT